MTTAEATPRQTEGAVPPPPPDVVPESQTIEPVPFARQLWDLVTLHDGLSKADLRSKARFPLGETMREYSRWHGGATATKEQADDDYFERGLQQGVDRGWLTVVRGRVKAGTCPPEHEPMKSLGKERSLRSRLHGDDERKAYNLLLDPKSAARHSGVTRRSELRKSLKLVGQLYPILRWQPFGNQPIIIDGVTRYELLRDLGVDEEDIKFKDLGDMTAVEALQLRIELEINSTSKDQQDDARNAYIAGLAQEGFTQESIAKLVGVSRQRVGAILSTMQQGLHRGQTPEPSDVAEFQRLSDAGWNLRAIAESTGWGKSTVSNYLNGTKTPKAKRTPAKATAPKTSRSSPQATAAATKRGVAPNTVINTGPTKVIATLDGRVDVVEAVMKDPVVSIKLLQEALTVPEHVDFLIQELVKMGLVTKV